MTDSLPFFCARIRSRRGSLLLFSRVALCLFLLPVALSSLAQTAPAAPPAHIGYDPATHTFRMDVADISYVFDVNEKGELQSIYWGKRLLPGDPFPAAHADRGGSFNPPVNATPQEFVEATH